jgi:hypothetical protein
MEERELMKPVKLLFLPVMSARPAHGEAVTRPPKQRAQSFPPGIVLMNYCEHSQFQRTKWLANNVIIAELVPDVKNGAREPACDSSPPQLC